MENGGTLLSNLIPMLDECSCGSDCQECDNCYLPECECECEDDTDMIEGGEDDDETLDDDDEDLDDQDDDVDEKKKGDDEDDEGF